MERRALGRGLASLISTVKETSYETPVVATSMEVRSGDGMRMVLVSSIRPNELQPRMHFDAAKIEELADSIRQKGILAPLIVSKKGEQYELISGERRLRAAQIAGLSEVPVIIREADSSEKLEIALIENIQRADLNSIEEGLAYQSLMERFGYTQEEVAVKVGKDRATIANMLRLLKLPSKAKEALQQGLITMGHARALLGITEIERQIYFLEKIISEGLTVRDLERRIADGRSVPRGRRRASKVLPDHLVEMVDQFRRLLGTQVHLLPSHPLKKGEVLGDKGKIVIDYYSQGDLDRIYRTVTRS
ncbi:MAG: ParB/RepB/Spo0J family partition protein [Deltaproteobacteria bacterium]|nr:ParB/RepB/Spo0J family partition protein [Deltaproteobacteria bacterium]